MPIIEAMRIATADFPLLLLRQQVETWAMRGDPAYATRADECTFAHRFGSG